MSLPQYPHTPAQNSLEQVLYFRVDISSDDDSATFIQIGYQESSIQHLDRDLPSQQPLRPMSQKDLTSVLAVDELLQGKSAIPNVATKYSQEGSERSKPLSQMTSQSRPWTHKPEDLTIREAAASCNGVTIGRNNIRCRMKYGSQILSSHEIMGFASRYERSLPEFILSLQVVDGTTRPRKHKDFARILAQAYKRKERLKVCWKDRVIAFEEVIAEG
ncbi:hypothetical protein G6011_00774 [Alternaria panax]|uniref:Uncharacterized protein n=1 Tax=Alternaria panax TaxID=48097 RepID=A0AAD4NV98_9PLEO|nr:hypothetical protein G6011_00774 [Alternaria panax]